MKGRLPYDRKTLWRCLLTLVGLVAMLRLSSGWGYAAIFPLIFWASMSVKSERLIFVLMAIVSVTIGNPNVMPKSGAFGLMQRASMLLLSGVMVSQLVSGRNSPLVKPFLLIMVFVFYMVIPSAFGWCPAISFLKLFLFSAVYLSFYGVANRVIMSRHIHVSKLRGVFLGFAVFFIFGSILLIPFPGIGQMGMEAYVESVKAGNDVVSLFMGMTNHSQMLGPVMAMFGTVLFADYIFSVRRFDWLYVSLLTCVPLLIWKTSSRTAMGSMFAGILFALFFFMRARGVRTGWKAKVLTFMNLLFLIGAVLLAVAPSVRGRATQFVRKFGNAETHGMTFEDITKSRMELWERSLDNFSRSPAFGNGFQVSDDMRHLKIRSYRNLLSASIEKGTWVVAILEEGGVIGMAVFLLFALVLVSRLLSLHAYIGTSAFLAMLVVNLGEFTIFSMSGAGGLEWALIFIGTTLDARRNEESLRRLTFCLL